MTRIPSIGYKPLIGVVHLPPMPGSARGLGGIERLIDYAVSEAKKLEEAGFDAVLLENYSDAPYPRSRLDRVTLAALSVAAREVARNVSIPVGVSALRNAALDALAAAYASGARFIRVNVYCETRTSPEGILEPAAYTLEKLRQQLDRHIALFADVDVKHSGPLGSRSLEDIVHDCTTRGAPDALIASGPATSAAPSPGYVAGIKKLAGETPVLVGSGVTADNLKAYWNIADGFIVGTSIKVGHNTRAPIDLQAARKLASKARELRASEEA